MTAARRVAVAILAAGRAERFGTDKLLHALNGKPLAAHIADTIADDPPGPRFAIVPPASPARARLFAARGFALVENPNAEQGMGTSLACAASTVLTLDVGALLVCLADMPLVTRAHLDALLAVEADVVATEAAGVRSPPIAFARAVFPDLLELTGDHGPRHLLSSAAVVLADTAIVRDFDTPEDFD